ncbi:hypothetical protein CEB3_c27420 [Peptococcaceae bacterium CEB3]|nr:hypothetical protein CEB3_c27420 [Peptococcaceae bacterium CEB3]
MVREEIFKKEVLLYAHEIRRQRAEWETVEAVDETLSFLTDEIGRWFEVCRRHAAAGSRFDLPALMEELADLRQTLQAGLLERIGRRFDMDGEQAISLLAQEHLASDLWQERMVEDFLGDVSGLIEGWRAEKEGSVFWAGQAEYWSRRVWGEAAHRLIPHPLLAALAEQAGAGEKMVASLGIDSRWEKEELTRGLEQRREGALLALEERLKREASRGAAQILYSLHDRVIERRFAAKTEVLEATLSAYEPELLAREA